MLAARPEGAPLIPAECALLAAQSVYDLGAMVLTGRCCHTDIMSSTAFRGFGYPQAMFLTECIFDHVAHQLGIDADQVAHNTM